MWLFGVSRKCLLNELDYHLLSPQQNHAISIQQRYTFHWMSACLMRLWRGSGFIFGLRTEGQWEMTDVVGRNCTHYYGLRIRTTWSRSARINTVLQPMRTFFLTLHTMPLPHNYWKNTKQNVAYCYEGLLLTDMSKKIIYIYIHTRVCV